jgi:hypothetical protein
MSITKELAKWTHECKCRKAVAALEKNGFAAAYCDSGNEAAKFILAEAANARTVGFGGSMTIADLNLAPRLLEQGKELLNHGAPGLSFEERLEIMHHQLSCDLFLSGSNALTLSGCLVNIDACGNRVGAMFFGPKKVIVVVGRNKLVDGTTDDAIRRVKNWASPPNARRLNYKTPCAETGFCCDCNGPERICRITVVMDRKPKYTDVTVLVVNEEMGL